MTKYEWERELKRHIAVLPKSEQARIFDYYGEIFEDRIEAGMRENDIIYEFGNPFDVAQKILADYRFDDTETVRPPRFRPQREVETNAAEHAAPSEPDLPPPQQDVRQTANFDHPPVRETQKSSGNWFGRFMLSRDRVCICNPLRETGEISGDRRGKNDSIHIPVYQR